MFAPIVTYRVDDFCGNIVERMRVHFRSDLLYHKATPQTLGVLHLLGTSVVSLDLDLEWRSFYQGGNAGNPTRCLYWPSRYPKQCIIQ